MPRHTPAALAAVAFAVTHFAVARADEPIQFNRDIRPILSENCYHCHGPDDAARQADMRLDIAEQAYEMAIRRGDANSSELVARITSQDAETVMPPPVAKRILSPRQIELLKRWIDQGADYDSHWSFIPPVKSALPHAADASLGPIDRFIRKRLASQNLRPAAPANRQTLIRRAAFDLIGLPPSLDEIDRFLADESPAAYERLIERLLSRSEFGERMASVWLDAARYSDTYGYQVDRDRFVWPWRDWVIGALNENLPYDKFITWQLAGDLLEDPSRDQILATTFNRLHPQKVEGGSVPEEFRIEYVADRTQTVATAIMGLTYECCRCHNHKYDPITQREYYELSAFFDNVAESGLYSYFTNSVPTPTLTLPTQTQSESLAEVTDLIELVGAEMRSLMISSTENQGQASAAKPVPSFAKPVLEREFEEADVGNNSLVEGVVGKAVRLTGDDAVSTKVGNFPRWQPFSVSLWIKTPEPNDRAVIFHRSRAWTDAGSRGYELLLEQQRLSWSLIHFWPGNAISIRTVDALAVDEWIHVAVTYDGSSSAGGLSIFVDGHRTAIEVVRDSLTKNITGGGGDTIAIGARFRDRGFAGGVVDRMRVFDLQLTELEVARLANRDEEIKASDDPTRVAVHNAIRGSDRMAMLQKELAELREQKCVIEDVLDEIMVMKEEPIPRQSYLLVRGAYDNHGDAVRPGTPAVFPRFPANAPPNRLGLARWLCDPKHPLTARVAVNRLWQICFGEGLVRTPEDFGSQGEPPTHPELLDWLAVDFVESGWDVKRMLKQIVMSETYQQSSSHADPRVFEIDPNNRWLARGASYRLSAEMLRDSALAVSGRLASKIGGPPVKPYDLQVSFKPSKPSTGDGLYRRSVYTYWKRTGPAPTMMTLDAAKRDVCQVRRERTSSPLQAFVLLNGPQYIEAARGLAELLTKKHGADARGVTASIRDLFRTLTTRSGTAAEISVLIELYESQLAYFEADSQRSDLFLAIGDADPDKTISPAHLAALTVVVNTLMNFDESVMKR